MENIETVEVFNEIKQIAEYDLKYNYINNSKIVDIDKLFEELKKPGTERLSIKVPYNEHIEWGKLYKNRIDLDNSNGTFPPMGMVYKALWGWGWNKEQSEIFRVTPLFDNVLFGGDWIYSLGRCAESDEESYRWRGCIGTFTLVPAYFNGAKDGHAQRNWENAMKILENEDWEIAKWVENAKPFRKGDYIKYKNAMLLWEFDGEDCGSNTERNIKILRRSYLMAAMLEIAVKFSKNEEIKYEHKDKWKEWDVSDIYKYIVEKVFLCEKKIYSDYKAVITAINKAVKNKREERKIYKILEKVDKLIENAEERLKELPV